MLDRERCKKLIEKLTDKQYCQCHPNDGKGAIHIKIPQ